MIGWAVNIRRAKGGWPFASLPVRSLALTRAQLRGFPALWGWGKRVSLQQRKGASNRRGRASWAHQFCSSTPTCSQGSWLSWLSTRKVANSALSFTDSWLPPPFKPQFIAGTLKLFLYYLSTYIRWSLVLSRPWMAWVVREVVGRRIARIATGTNQ